MSMTLPIPPCAAAVWSSDERQRPGRAGVVQAADAPIGYALACKFGLSAAMDSGTA
jgi:hypothetical protein